MHQVYTLKTLKLIVVVLHLRREGDKTRGCFAYPCSARGSCGSARGLSMTATRDRVSEMFKNRAFASFLMVAISCFGQTRPPAILDLLTPDEFRTAGLSKLTPQELNSLNASMMRIVIGLGTVGKSSSAVTSRDPAPNDTEYFDSRGAAVAYFDDDQTLYL